MSMFCYQCEQTAGGRPAPAAQACAARPKPSPWTRALTRALIALAAASGDSPSPAAVRLMVDGLFTPSPTSASMATAPAR